MLDIKYIRKYPDKVKQSVAAKKEKCDIDRILSLDSEKRAKISQVEELKHLRNKENEKISHAKKAGEDIAPIIAQMGEISNQIKALDSEVQSTDEEIKDLLRWVPNIPDDSVPHGGEEDNVVVRSWGDPIEHAFKAKPHWDLGKELDILQIDRAARMTGSGFTMLSGAGARLERALLNFMLDLHQQHGYREVVPPYVVNRNALLATGQLPKLENDMYHMEREDFFLIPTSEVSLVNYYQGEIIPGEQLPIRLMSATPCFRREAGAHGKDTRGLLRVHQFNKVELVHFTTQEESAEALDILMSHAEAVLQKLGLAYRVVMLATGDLTFASAKTYDLEIWAPGIEKWLEVSSCSNCTDFQARRGNIRYKFKKGKTNPVHTLNGSGVATPRLMVALLETYQQANGHITIPEVLQPYMGGQTEI